MNKKIRIIVGVVSALTIIFGAVGVYQYDPLNIFNSD
jgi:hypothetical protein